MLMYAKEISDKTKLHDANVIEKRTLSPFERLQNRVLKQFKIKKFIGDIEINDEEMNYLLIILE